MVVCNDKKLAKNELFECVNQLENVIENAFKQIVDNNSKIGVSRGLVGSNTIYKFRIRLATFTDLALGLINLGWQRLQVIAYVTCSNRPNI